MQKSYWYMEAKCPGSSWGWSLLVKILYVRNLFLETSEEDIKKFFMPDCGGEIERVKKIRDFAFVHFSSREAAEKSLEATKGKKLDGCTLEVTWAKPINQFYQKVKKQFDRRKATTRQYSYKNNIGNVGIPVVSQSRSHNGSQSDPNPTYINGFHYGQSPYNCAESFQMSNAVDLYDHANISREHRSGSSEMGFSSESSFTYPLQNSLA